MKKICQRAQRFISLCLCYAALSATAQPVFTNLNFFTSTASDGGLPVGLVASGAMLFGATQQGGSASVGTVYVMGTNGANYSVLYNFTNKPDGATPNELVLSGGTLYGTTYQGGITNNYGTIFKIGTNGTGYTILRQFTNSPDAQQPVAGLVLGGDTLYGTSLVGGSNNNGTIFKIDTNGANYAVLRHFTNGLDGSQPRGRLLLIGAALYGTTAQGGSNSSGTHPPTTTQASAYARRSSNSPTMTSTVWSLSTCARRFSPVRPPSPTCVNKAVASSSTWPANWASSPRATARSTA